MRYLILTDVHANLEALQAVLANAGAYDGVLFLGDLVGYGPNPNACVNLVAGLPGLTCLLGNHDLAALGRLDLAAFNPVARAAARWTGSVLSAPSRDFLSKLTPRVDGADYVLAHGSPREPVWEYLETVLEARDNFTEYAGACCFVGHTHVPRIFTQDGASGHVTLSGALDGDRLALVENTRYIINPGGVGQPRDNDPRAAYALWDTGAGELSFRRVPYDVTDTQAKIRAAGLPEVLAARLSGGM